MYDVSNNLQTSLFLTLLEDAIIKLKFVGACNHELRIYKTLARFKDLQHAKFGVMPPKEKDELRDIDPNKLGCEQHKMRKLYADRAMCIKVFTDTYVEMALNQNFKPLADYVQSTEYRNAYSFFLEEDQARNKVTRHELYRKLRQQRNHIKSALYEVDSVIQEHTTQLNDSTLIKMCEARYVDKCEAVRSELNAWRIQKAEAESSQAIAYYRQKLEEEFRIHAELERLTNIQRTEYLREAEDVMSKYEDDIRPMEVKVERMHSNYNDQLVKRRAMEESLASRQAEIEGWLQFKKDQEKYCQYRMKMNRAAIIVQAWWRGLITRLNLGRYAETKTLKDRKYMK